MTDEKTQPNQNVPLDVPPDAAKLDQIEMQQGETGVPAQTAHRPAPPRQPLFRK